ncbi:MAG: elongation factor P [Candidatus Komeilibacteria bacterium RIFCSPLOWO2_01_FULL_53_11]|uniref:Elongation factor P n=1 Tax=Candidatus Komeilibacteria bacterium RIFCSPLOWO2_01_FULL_53_11 TaxID=1798552 RepID=A0A1G2BWL6_9BACT|nr:MAG: elongation factor P [Candidatus Komeilibacteria bacterium RIFCSPLOWO2_01_FULL_53_11]
MLSMSDIKLGSFLTVNEQPYVVTFTQHIKMARSGATLRTKLKNLVTGSTLERSFSGGDRAEEADLARRKATFLYSDDQNCFFMDGESFEQYEFANDVLGEKRQYLKESQAVDILLYNGKAVTVELPKKITLTVTSSPPGVRGDTSGSPTKSVTLETGLELRVPLFIKEGDLLRINTDTGDYVERA